MAQIMSDEYALITGKDATIFFNRMWKHTSLFQEKFHKKERFKKKFLLKK